MLQPNPFPEIEYRVRCVHCSMMFYPHPALLIHMMCSFYQHSSGKTKVLFFSSRTITLGTHKSTQVCWYSRRSHSSRGQRLLDGLAEGQYSQCRPHAITKMGDKITRVLSSITEGRYLPYRHHAFTQMEGKKIQVLVLMGMRILSRVRRH